MRRRGPLGRAAPPTRVRGFTWRGTHLCALVAPDGTLPTLFLTGEQPEEHQLERGLLVQCFAIDEFVRA